MRSIALCETTTTTTTKQRQAFTLGVNFKFVTISEREPV